jgi:hypothetical protein
VTHCRNFVSRRRPVSRKTQPEVKRPVERREAAEHLVVDAVPAERLDDGAVDDPTGTAAETPGGARSGLRRAPIDAIRMSEANWGGGRRQSNVRQRVQAEVGEAGL